MIEESRRLENPLEYLALTLFFSEYHDRYFSFEIRNVRAEQRESRELMQNLEDIRNGIQIVHASDAEKRNEENKKERHQKLRESAIRRLEKKLLENGYESLEKFSRQSGASETRQAGRVQMAAPAGIVKDR